MTRVRIERWALSGGEMARLATLRSIDELFAVCIVRDVDNKPLDACQVIVLRDGTVTGRRLDGCGRAPEHAVLMAATEDRLFHPSGGAFEPTNRWEDVVVGEDGAFLMFAVDLPDRALTDIFESPLAA